MLRAMHGGQPRILGEDFSGTGAISRAWVGLSPKANAVAVDHDAATLARAKGVSRVTTRCMDVMKATDAADVIAVLNFSICELHERRALVRYFKHVKSRLRVDGVLVMDIYGGSDAYNTGRIAEQVKLPDGRRVRYEWEQRHADSLTGRVVNAMHFRVTSKGGKPMRVEDAFVYNWRLWSVPELREAMMEAGFETTEVYARFAEAQDGEGNLYVSPVQDAAEVGDSYSVYVVGRV